MHTHFYIIMPSRIQNALWYSNMKWSCSVVHCVLGNRTDHRQQDWFIVSFMTVTYSLFTLWQTNMIVMASRLHALEQWKGHIHSKRTSERCINSLGLPESLCRHVNVHWCRLFFQQSSGTAVQAWDTADEHRLEEHRDWRLSLHLEQKLSR